MSSSEIEPASGTAPRPDDADPKKREEEVINLIRMSIDALSYMTFDPEPDVENMAKWFALEAVKLSTGLEGSVRAKAYKQLSECCRARNEWAEAAWALEDAKAADKGSWTAEDLSIHIQFYKVAVRAKHHKDKGKPVPRQQELELIKRKTSVLDD